MYYVYVMTNKRGTALYTGVTNGLTRRLFEHSAGRNAAFTKRYSLNRLIYFEPFEDIDNAVAREKQIKRWRREKKIELIKRTNPLCANLAKELFP